MKGGIVYPDFVTTVSPNHAGEARYGDGAFGLGHTLNVHQHKFRGILNGVDYDVWNPEVDARIPARYSAADLHGKYEDKERLRDRFWLRKSWSPIVAFVGRLDEQKACRWSTKRCSTRSPGERSSCYLGSRCTRRGSAVTSAISSTS
jgi:starch synthase